MADNKNNNEKVKQIAITVAVVLALIVGGGFLIRQNAIEQERKKDPEGILGQTIGQIKNKYCADKNSGYDKYLILERSFSCYDFDKVFVESDLDNYKLVYYNQSLALYGGWTFGFDIDKSQTDQRPLKVENPEQFVGKMATELCPKYSLADFKIYAAGEHMGISTIPCKDINEYSMYQDVIITDAYYGADEENGDNPDEYYEQNNSKGTRTLYFDGEYLKDRPTY